MSLSPQERDFYEERRRSWRRSAFWRGFLIAAVIGGVIGAAVSFSGSGVFSPHIARLSIDGAIYDDPERLALIRDIQANENVRAVVVRINSPGGTSSGSEALYEALRDVANDKPIVAVMSEVAASGGYIAAIAADHIIARGNTLTGSIGVILEYPDVTELLDRVGIAFKTVRSSDLKAEPAPYRTPSAEALAVQEALIADSYAWFRDLVAERRNLSGTALDAAANGQVFTGRTALDAGLIDAIGGEAEALAHLTELDAELADLPVEVWELTPEDGGIWSLLSRAGMGELSFQALPTQTGPRLWALYK